MSSAPSWNCPRMESCEWSTATGSMPPDLRRRMHVCRIPPSQHQNRLNRHLNQQSILTSSTSHSQTTPKSRRDDLPVKPVKSSQSSSSRAPKPQRKRNLKAISDKYNRFHALDELDRIDDPDPDLEPNQSINQSINQVYYFSSTLQARFHKKNSRKNTSALLCVSLSYVNINKI